ncbi:3'-5' exonuclease [Methylobacterium segetis]|uniref:3'-5' exonuclease n=1 Tax=Methylobacterium segetis TaxID=2488750 RepID=UPI0010437363|nr:3'-5' exonuclease [Methylobacterium segetis]
MLRSVRRAIDRARISDPRYAFLFGEAPPDEVVAVDCETTGLNLRKDEIITIAAIRIRGDRILTSERFEALAKTNRKSAPEAIKVHRILDHDLQHGRPMREIMPELLHFVGSRPIVGYYTDFDVGMIDRYLLRLLRIHLPNKRIDVSSMYYKCKYRDAPDHLLIDLSFDSILKDLSIPAITQHDASNDALMTAMIYLQLRDMLKRGVRIPRMRAGAIADLGIGA